MSCEDWVRTKLINVIELKRGYDLPSQKRLDGKIPIVSSSGISGFHNEAKVKAPGVVTGRYGTLGKVFYLKNDFWPLNTTLFVNNFKGNNPKFISYMLQTVNFLKYSDKAAVPGVNRNHLHEADVIIPPLPEQRDIAKILSSLDDKIELNNLINKTLEDVGQAIFKRWFVDFEFPNQEGKPYKSSGGEMVDSEIGKIPKGWKFGNFGKIIEEVNERVRSNSLDYEVLSAIKTGQLISSEEYFKKRVYSKDLSKYKRVKLNEFAYNPARINIGSIGMLAKKIEGIVSPVYVVFKPHSGYHYFIFLSLRREGIKQRIIQFCSGTVRQNLDFHTFSKIELTIPPEFIVKLFNEDYAKIVESINHNKLQIQTAIKIRDLLLPKLISGRIRVPFNNQMEIP